MNYLNEIDPVAAAWLRELRDIGLIPPCDIDTRSIEDVEPRELAGYTQCHFFAGIAGWPLALQLAGWPANRPIWTGSCPCQPFSAAGKGRGFADERHLWPAFHWLIAQCRPAVVVGEQVAGAAGGHWLDLVLTDLEALGYAGGAYAGPAAGVGAPHVRQRVYWVADADGGHPCATGLQHGRQHGQQPEDGCDLPKHDSSADRGWSSTDWLCCHNGKWRPVEPGASPLAHGLPARMGRLRGYGNAIVPQQAAEFLKAVMAYRPANL